MKRRRAAVLAGAIVVACELQKEEEILKRKKRAMWTRQLFVNREEQGFFKQFNVMLRNEDPELFKNFVRMDASDFDLLVELVKPCIEKQDTKLRKAITAAERLAVTLRFLATGDSYASLMNLFQMSRSSICNIISVTCQALYDQLKGEYIKVPTTHKEWAKIAHQFEQRWNFPNCCGVLDGKHCNIKAPANSVVVMALADADYKFTYVEVGSDEGVFACFDLSCALENNTINFPPPRSPQQFIEPLPYVIVADDAFPIEQYLMKPYAFQNLDKKKKKFNYRLLHVRRIIENVFGICASRFRVLLRTLEMSPEKCTVIVLAICALHNFLITRKSCYTKPTDFDRDIDGIFCPGTWREELGESSLQSVSPLHTGGDREGAQEVRDKFMTYFSSIGGVEWKDEIVNA